MSLLVGLISPKALLYLRVTLLKISLVDFGQGCVRFSVALHYKFCTLVASFQIVAMACINLASKIEEAPRRIRDVINVFHHLRQLRGKR